MLFVATTVDFADRSTLSIAGDAMRDDLGISSGELGVPFSAFLLVLPRRPTAGRPAARPLRLEEGPRHRALPLVGLHHAPGAIGFFAGAAGVLLFVLRFAAGLAEAPSFPGNSRIVAA